MGGYYVAEHVSFRSVCCNMGRSPVNKVLVDHYSSVSAYVDEIAIKHYGRLNRLPLGNT